MNFCRICKKMIQNPVPEVGSNTPFEMQIVAKLSEHISNDHPDLDKALHIAALNHVGILRLSQFNIMDQNLKRQVDEAKWNLMMGLRGPALTKEETEKLIDDQLSELSEDRSRNGMPGPICSSGFMRNSLRRLIDKVYRRTLELDKYQPSNPTV